MRHSIVYYTLPLLAEKSQAMLRELPRHIVHFLHMNARRIAQSSRIQEIPAWSGGCRRYVLLVPTRRKRPDPSGALSIDLGTDPAVMQKVDALCKLLRAHKRSCQTWIFGPLEPWERCIVEYIYPAVRRGVPANAPPELMNALREECIKRNCLPC